MAIRSPSRLAVAVSAPTGIWPCQGFSRLCLGGPSVLFSAGPVLPALSVGHSDRASASRLQPARIQWRRSNRRLGPGGGTDYLQSLGSQPAAAAKLERSKPDQQLERPTALSPMLASQPGFRRARCPTSKIFDCSASLELIGNSRQVEGDRAGEAMPLY